MHNLEELQRRKAALKAKIELQRSEIKKTFLEVREEIEPANLLKKAVQGLFRTSKAKSNELLPGQTETLSPTMSFLADLLIKDPRIAMVVKLLAPLAWKMFPKGSKAKKAAETPETPEEPVELPVKAKVYGSLRQSVSTLRKRLRKKKENTATVVEPETTEN